MPLSKNLRRSSTPDGGVLLDIRRGLLFRASPLACRILDLVEAGARERQIVDEISRISEIRPEIVEADVREFLASLHHYQLLDVPRSDVPHAEK